MEHVQLEACPQVAVRKDLRRLKLGSLFLVVGPSLRILMGVAGHALRMSETWAIQHIMEKGEACKDKSKLCTALTSVRQGIRTVPVLLIKSSTANAAAPLSPSRTERKNAVQRDIRLDEMGKATSSAVHWTVDAVRKERNSRQKRTTEYSAVQMALRELPKNPYAVNDICYKSGAQPVKIENAEQNRNLPPHTIIGLQIPENDTWGKNSFRWVSDSSTPTYTNWCEGEPNNGNNDNLEDEVLVVTWNNGCWMDIHPSSNYLSLSTKVVCMTEVRDGY
uniref:C-type lectin domain-containing protein n=1 Tax=Steinernema glaseri TaxID=37863 RepID=A0A1I7Z1C4_9BILA